MPPSSPPSDNQTAVADYIALTNQDVEILHEIVTTAQQSPNVDSLPFRAIFAAYDQVLAQHGLDSDHDQLYLRFLFRLGDKREPGQSLYEAFEAVLLELGIQLLFGTEEEGSQEADVTKSITNYSAAPDATSVARGRPRRASFNSYHDADNESSRANKLRGTSRASLSRLQKFRSTTRATTRATERVLSRHQPSEPARNPDPPARPISRESLRISQPYGQSNDVMRDKGRQASYVPKHEGTMQKAVHRSQSYSAGSYGSNELSDENVALGSYSSTAGRQFSPPQSNLYLPSETQLLRDADTFQYFRIRSVAGSALRKWQILALDARHIHRDMERRAASYDVNTLLRQAYDQWRTLFRARKHRAETEKFFDHLERKASKARDLYLLTKAFTHWAQCTSEELERVSFARRHILRTRYFHAWQDITVVNEFKVRHQWLKKFLYLWRHKYESSYKTNTRAVTLYYSNLVETLYWRWFWNFCERRAPVWKDGRLQRQYFVQWLLVHSAHAQKTLQATAAYEDRLKRRYFGRWLEKMRDIQVIEHQSELFYGAQLKEKSLSAWRVQLKYLPLYRRIAGMVNWRIASSNFLTLTIRFQLERRAAQVNRERILRNAWTHWNDRLRWQTLARQINDRLLMESLYKWVLAERFALLKRLCEERLQRRALNTILKHYKTLRADYNEAYESIVDSRNRTLSQLALRSWQGQLRARGLDNRLAFEFRAPEVVQKYLHIWTASGKHFQQLQKWSEDAAYYFRGTRTLKQWQTAVLENQSRKRRNAYVSVRRVVKMNLARRMLCRWHEQASHISTLQQRAQEISQQRILLFATSMFDCWRDRFHFSLAENLEASRNFEADLVYQHLQLWLDRFRSRTQNQTEAQDFAGSHVQKIAYETLRALQLKLFEHRSRNKTAADLKAWNEKHHHQTLLRKWREKADRKRGVAVTDFASSYRYRRSTVVTRVPVADVAAAPGARPEDAESSTAFGDDFVISDWIPALEAQRSLTPLPGYLSTPSKRAARARAIVHGSNTPATPVGLRTPMLRRLYAQSATESRLGLGAAGRSVKGFRPSGFEDVTEREWQTP